MERQDNQMLMRVVAMLLLLAGLAMRASSASHPVRCRVFVILIQAEAVTRLYAPSAGVSARAPSIGVSGPIEPTDLMSIAVRFCMLALMLRIAATRGALVPSLADRAGSALLIGGMSIGTTNVVNARAARGPAAPDTS